MAGTEKRSVALTMTAAAVVVSVLAGATSEIRVGSVSVSALVTAGAALAGVFLSPLLGGTRAFLSLPAMAFLVLTSTRVLIAPTSDGLQNVAAYAILFLVPAFVAHTVGPADLQVALRWFTIAGLAATGLFAVEQSLGVLTDGVRSYALAALPLLAASIVQRDRRWLFRAAPLLITIGIVASLSRTASAVAVVMLAGLVVRRARTARLRLAVGALVGLSGATAAVWAVVPAIRARFTTGDNGSVGGLSVNTSGRTNLWEALSEHARSAPVFGHGPGSAAQFVQDTFVTVRQPHNDWLRLLHDTGWVGVGLFGLAILMLLIQVARAAHRSDQPVHWAALFALVALVATAITDNTLIYPFAIGSTAVLVGLSIGTAPRPGAPTDDTTSPTTTKEGTTA